MKIIIWGVGYYFMQCKNNILHNPNFEIIAITDNDSSKWETYIEEFESKVLSPTEALKLEYDKILILTKNYKDIYIQLLCLGIDNSKLAFLSLHAGLYRHNFIIETDGKNDYYTIQKKDCEEIHFKISKTASSDSFILDEFYLGEYNYLFQKENTVVIDIGMNIAIPTINFASNKYVSNVYSFEPFPETYEQAISNIALNSNTIANKIKTYNFALLDYDGTQSCYFNPQRTGRSSLVLELISEYTVDIQVRNAATILKEIIDNHNNQPIIMKIDCEGSEHRIFQHLNEFNLISKFDVIMMEWHDSYSDLIDILTQNNFSLLTMSRENRIASGMIYAINNKNSLSIR